MPNYKKYLEKTGEIGTVTQVIESMVYVQGIPSVHPGEVVIFENDTIGYVLGMKPDQVEVLLLSRQRIDVGAQVSRTGSPLQINVNEKMLGKFLSPAVLENETFVLNEDEQDGGELKLIDVPAATFEGRAQVIEPLETGVTIVDLLVPLAKGQRELVIGDRKTGKTNFLLQTILTQARAGTICIYAAVGKPQLKIQNLFQYLERNKVLDKSILIGTDAAHRPGLIFLTPYVAMTVAEYFRDQGHNVLLIIDDLTTHARYYRELTLLAKRFPGRSSYPGDIFYVHARLLERAGSFEKGTITCLPVAHAVQGDLSGYIQSNLMGMTDGHIYFDTDFFDQGRRPAINAFLSVTRVGQQTQTPLLRDISRELRAFLVHFEKIKQFKHFQTELSEGIQESFNLGERLIRFLDQTAELIIPININAALCGTLWAGFWKSYNPEEMKKNMNVLVESYQNKPEFRKQVDVLVSKSTKLKEITDLVQANNALFLNELPKKGVPGETPAQVPAVAQPVPQMDGGIPSNPLPPAVAIDPEVPAQPLK